MNQNNFDNFTDHDAQPATLGEYERLSRIVSGLAHEIKNPLSTVNLNLKLLGEDLARYHDPEHDRLVRRLHRVQQECDRLKQTLDDFLRYAGRCELSCSRVDIRDTISEMYDFYGPQAQAARVVMRITLPDSPIFCMIDQNLIKQSILNLLINATQAMPEGGELIVKLSEQNNNAKIEVIDTGLGIAPEKLSTIFDPYFSTKAGGSGLGLATALRIIREHTGDMKVDSELGKGTRFTITLKAI